MAKRYQKAEVIRILGEVESGKKIAEVCRRYGVSRATVHRWQRKYPAKKHQQYERLKNMEREEGPLNDSSRGKAYLQKLEVENARLKKIVAHQAIDIDVLQDLVGRPQDC